MIQPCVDFKLVASALVWPWRLYGWDARDPMTIAEGLGEPPPLGTMAFGEILRRNPHAMPNTIIGEIS